MTSTTTTKSTINEVINSMDYNTGYQFSVSGSGVEVIDNKSVSPSTTGVNATINGNSTTWTGVGSRPDFKQSVPGAAFQYTETYMGPGTQQSYDHRKRNDHRKHNRNYKRLYAVIVALFCATPAHAETVGGVSATAAPVANSSGSVTNQAYPGFTGSIRDHLTIWGRHPVPG